MNAADTLRGLLRRWYIVVPGIALAVAGMIGAYVVIQPGYERTATQLLLPGEGTVPPGVTNPYLYLGGLTQASDIVVRVMQGEDVAGKTLEEFPGTEVVVQRDPTVSGPVIQIIVTATTDEAAGAALDRLVAQTSLVLDKLQDDQRVSADDRMTVATLTQDGTSALQQRTRLMMSAGAFGVILILTILLASLVDGLIRRPRRARRQGGDAAPRRDSAVEEEAPADDDDDPVDDGVETSRRDADEPSYAAFGMELLGVTLEDQALDTVGVSSSRRREDRRESREP